MSIEGRLSGLEVAVAAMGDSAAERRSRFPHVSDSEMAELRAWNDRVFPEMAAKSDVSILELHDKIAKAYPAVEGCDECRSAEVARINNRADLDRLYATPATKCTNCGRGYWEA